MNVHSLSATSVVNAASSDSKVLGWMNLLYKTSDSFFGDELQVSARRGKIREILKIKKPLKN
jgi:hypothetical protein